MSTTTKTTTNFSKNGQVKATDLKKAPKKEATSKTAIQSSQLMKLLHDGLKDIYWAEKALTKAIPKMIKKASSNELVEALTSHLLETEDQIKRLEQVFKLLDKKAVGAKCEAMAGLMKEAEEIMEDCKPGAMRDAGIIAGGQKIEHYEIASYGTLSQFAKTLGFKEVVKLLDKTLEEEKAADVKLTEVAVATINIDASEKKA